MTQKLSKRIEKLLDRIESVCPVRQSAERVMMLSGNADADISQLADAISADPALAAETMRIANSAVFRRGSAATSLQQAVMKLGLEQINQMASGMAMLSRFGGNDPLTHELRDRSVFAATIAGLIATELGSVDRGTAFLAGLLCEIGGLALCAVDSGYGSVFHEASGFWPVREVLERDRYGLSTWELAGRMLKRNRTDEQVVQAIETGFDLRCHDDVGVLTKIVSFCRVVAPETIGLEPEQLREKSFRVGEIRDAALMDDVDVDRLLFVIEWASASFEMTIASTR